MAFTCPSCKTQNRYGLQTRGNGSRFYGCNGQHRDAEGRPLRSCTWSCEEHLALEVGITTPKDEVLRIAFEATRIAETIAVRAIDQRELRKAIGDAAESFEGLGDRLRLVADFLLSQEEENPRAAARPEEEDRSV